MNKPEKTGDKQEIRDKSGRFKKGVSGNPKGKPAGTLSIKTKIRQRFEKNPKALKEFMNVLIEKYPGLVWQMLEGRPPQDLNLGQNPELPFIIKIEKDDRKDTPTNGGEEDKDVPQAV